MRNFGWGDWILATFVLVLTVVLSMPIYAFLDAALNDKIDSAAEPSWQCIAPIEDIGWAMYCDVGDCHVLFYGDDFRMECE